MLLNLRVLSKLFALMLSNIKVISKFFGLVLLKFRVLLKLLLQCLQSLECCKNF